ncbi:MAG: hypothetical protein JXB17_12895 [Bacteroidales bacterium]|nr:hypothetical protein [Bacteroidales bacterium]
MQRNIISIIKIVFSILFFVASFLYFSIYIDPTVIYYKQQPLFLFDYQFIIKYLSFPGGFSTCLSLFTSQFLFSKWAGAVVITIFFYVISVISLSLFKRFFSEKTSFFLQFIPVILLIHLHSNYEYDFRGGYIYLFSILACLAYLKLPKISLSIKVLFLIVINIILFALFGGTALLLFSLLVILSELYFRNTRYFWVIMLLQPIIIISILFISINTSAYINFNMALWGILHPETHYKPLKLLYVFIFFLPLFLLVKVVFKKYLKTSYLYNQYKSNLPGKRNYFSLLLFIVLLFATEIFAFKFSYKQEDKKFIQIHQFADDHNWKMVLKLGKELPYHDRRVLFQVNRALCHQNQLLDKAFSYVQFCGDHGLLLTKHYNRQVLMLISDLYFDMGHIKESLHWAYEAQTIYDYSPEVIKRIIINNIILGEYTIANKFLIILSKSPVHKSWTGKCKKYFKDESLITNDPLIAEKRRLLPIEDFHTSTKNPQNDLKKLFIENVNNKMAFEYFIAYALLTHDLSSLAVYFDYFEKLNYTLLPVHVEEAIILFITLNNNYPLNLGKYSISELTQKRFIEYSKILMKYKHNSKIAEMELHRYFHDTFWFYIHYISPITTKREIQVKNLK